jgi:hypothetical protein
MSYTEANYDSVSTGSFSSAPFTVIPVTSCYNPVSMQEHESVDGEILIYPNPTNGTFTLSLPELSAETTVHIFSVDGRCVKSLEPRAANTQVDVSGFSDGFYLIEINSKNTHRVERLKITR